MKITKLLICLGALSACALFAQDDPPSRVARLSYTYGAVSFQPGDVNDWFPADPNRPLTTGDHVFVDPASTAELQVGTGALLLGSNTAMDILNLDDSNVQVRLTQGTLIIRIHTLGDQENFEIDTPNLAFTLLRTGLYRIEVPPNSANTLVTVRAGEGQLTGPDQTFNVEPGQQIQVAGVDQPSYQNNPPPPLDTLERFSGQRQQAEDALQSSRYCSHDMVGYQDLDKYGSWRSTPDYGMVWVPNGTPTGWAPYHNGHWLWVDPWGWTWVDDAPWGFAPFHYGRWAYVGYWAWVPGPVAERPVYAPALVAWVGGGSVGGGVGWFPLGPREVFVPTYHTSPTYLTRVNVTNTVIVNKVNITNVNVTNVTYVNRTAPGAVMAVQREAFANARPVQSAAIAIEPNAARSAAVVATVAVAPTRASIVRPAAPSANVPKPPPAIQARAVVVKKTPPPAPVPFAQKQAALASNGGRPLDRSQVQQLRQSQPEAPRPQIKQVQARPPTQAPAQGAPAQVARPNAQTPPQQSRPGTQPSEAIRPPQRPTPTAPTIQPPAPRSEPAQTPPARPQPQTREATPPQRPAPTTQQPEPRPDVQRPAPTTQQAPPQRTPPAAQAPAQRPDAQRPATTAPPSRPSQTKAGEKDGKKNEKDKKTDKKDEKQ